MARVTVEDCLDNVDNRFELVMLATKRSRQLATGGKEPKVAPENDKPTVIALREIANGLINYDVIAERASKKSRCLPATRMLEPQVDRWRDRPRPRSKAHAASTSPSDCRPT